MAARKIARQFWGLGVKAHWMWMRRKRRALQVLKHARASQMPRPNIAMDVDADAARACGGRRTAGCGQGAPPPGKMVRAGKPFRKLLGMHSGQAKPVGIVWMGDLAKRLRDAVTTASRGRKYFSRKCPKSVAYRGLETHLTTFKTLGLAGGDCCRVIAVTWWGRHHSTLNQNADGIWRAMPSPMRILDQLSHGAISCTNPP